MGWEDRSYYREGPPPRMRISMPMPAPMTMAVMGACLAIFLIQSFGIPEIPDYAKLYLADYAALRQPWRWITYQYVHANGGHIFWNLLGLYFFLSPIEKVWGWRRALAFYTVGGIVAGLTYALMCAFLPDLFASGGLVGASGSILACLGACAYLFPEMVLLIIPIRVAAALYAVLYLLQIAGDKNLADAAHLGGLAFGFFAPYYGGRAWHRLQRGYAHHRTVRGLRQEQDDESAVDRILQKVHDHGMHGLSRSDRRTLERATARIKQAASSRSPRSRR